MFFSITEVNVRATPGLSGEKIDKIANDETIEVQGDPVVEDGWLWHKLHDRDGWVAECRLDGKHVLMEWQGTEPPPAIPLTGDTVTTGLPEQLAGFTNQQLLEAIQMVANEMEPPGDVAEWVRRGRLSWLANDLSASYRGDPIAALPYLSSGMKTAIINQLRLMGEGDAASVEGESAVESTRMAQSTSTRAAEDAGAIESAPQSTVITGTATFTHQQLINAFYAAGSELDLSNPFQYIDDAGLSYIASDRDTEYSGDPLEELPNLEDGIKQAVINSLAGELGANPIPAEAPPVGELHPFSADGNQLLLNGRPFRFVGVNLREFAYYGFPHHGLTKFNNDGHMDLQLDTAKEMGAQVVRFYAPMNVNENGQRGTDLKFVIRRCKAALDKVHQRGMYAIVTLTDAKWSGFDVVDSDEYRGPGSYIYNLDWYRSGYKETYLPFVRDLAKAIGDHPAIFCWAVGNEMQVFPHPPDPSAKDCQAIVDFFKAASETVRKGSPSKMITTGIESSFHLFVGNAYGGGKYSNKLYGLSTIDLVCMHTYQSHDDRSNMGHNHDKILTEADLARKVWKKPIFMEEIGPTGGKNRGDGGAWLAPVLQQLFDLGFSGALQWGFSAADTDIGVGDSDSGMHHTPGGHALAGHDWNSMFSAYRNWGSKFWT